MSPTRWIVALLCLQSIFGQGQNRSSNDKMAESMKWSCKTPPFLSVSVSTMRRDAIPQTQLRLTDPSSREQGANVSTVRIPKSHYEQVVEYPPDPDHSRAHAVEVCDAEQGVYRVLVYEHGDGQYRLAVTVGHGNSLIIYRDAKEAQIRHFRFSLKVEKGNGEVSWLDNNE